MHEKDLLRTAIPNRPKEMEPNQVYTTKRRKTMTRPFRFEKDLDVRYDKLTEEIYRISNMEEQLKGAIETAAQMERTYSAFDGVAGLLQSVLVDIDNQRIEMQRVADDLWNEIELRGENT